MTKEKREDVVFTMSDNDIKKLSTSELKYVCKHTLLNIKYKVEVCSNKDTGKMRNRTLRDRKDMIVEILKRRRLITSEMKAAYELRQSRLEEFRSVNAARRSNNIEPYKSFKDFWETEHPDIPYKPAVEFYAENGIDVTKCE